MTPKFCFIMRGIPGSGKSTTAKYLARILARQWAEVMERNDGGVLSFIENELDFSQTTVAAIHSTDQFFIKNGKYEFDQTKLQQYHNANFVAFKNSLEQGVPTVICDNTNSTFWEYDKYYIAAQRAGYITSIVEMPHPSVEEACRRNTHGVPGDVIKKMLRRWEPFQGKKQ